MSSEDEKNEGGNECLEALVPIIKKIEDFDKLPTPERIEAISEKEKKIQKLREELDEHFRKLADSRKTPVFAIEHPYTHDDVKILTKIFRNDEDWGGEGNYLFWCILSAEHGYHFEGSRYWPEFEDNLHYEAWRTIFRDHIWGYFQKFKKKFNGYTPTGAWAAKFTNICWPTSHAILPKYLLQEFVYHLHIIRDDLHKVINQEPDVIGNYLRDSYYYSDSKTRFEKLLEQTQLMGMICRSIIIKDDKEHNSIIYDKTLDRIVNDFSDETKELLAFTRGAIKENQEKEKNKPPKGPRSPTFDGGKKPGKEPKPGSEEYDLNDIYKNINISPIVKLRKKEKDKWVIVLEFPGFKSYAQNNKDTWDLLTNIRCKVINDKIFQSAGWILHKNPQREIDIWPEKESPLLKFDTEDYQAEIIAIQKKCSLLDFDHYIFKIRKNDNTAIKLKGYEVSPGNDYILISNSVIEARGDFIKEIDVGGPKVHSYLINIVEPYIGSVTNLLRMLRPQIEIRRKIKIAPIGLISRRNDDEGYYEWFDSETPCFSISYDHSVKNFEICLNGDTPIQVKANDNDDKVFISLENLDTGTHTLEIAADNNAIAKCELEIWIKKQEDIFNYSLPTGLRIFTEPARPDLNDLTDSKIELTTMGPKNTEISLKLRLLEDDIPFYEMEITKEKLPFDDWQNLLSKHFENKNNDIGKYTLDCENGELVIDAGVLGEKTVYLEKGITPLRIIYKKINKKIHFRIVDDTVNREDSNKKVIFLPIEEPVEEEELEYEECAKKYTAFKGQGGLIIVGKTLWDIFEEKTKGNTVRFSWEGLPDISFVDDYMKSDNFDSIIINSKTKKLGLADLGFRPKINFSRNYLLESQMNPQEKRKLIAFYFKWLSYIYYWKNAKAVGQMVTFKKNRVLKDLKSSFLEILCGKEWVQAEDDYINNKVSKHGRIPSTQLISKIDDEHYANRLYRMMAEQRTWLSIKRKHKNFDEELSKQYISHSGDCFDMSRRDGNRQQYLEFIFDLANNTENIFNKYKDDTIVYLDSVHDEVTLIKGARFLYLFKESGYFDN